MRKTTIGAYLVTGAAGFVDPSALLFLPAVSFCGAIPWWHFCRVKYPPPKKVGPPKKKG